jgi:dihydrodipicolinate synthase/N-acetylneuraminate lyase
MSTIFVPPDRCYDGKLLQRPRASAGREINGVIAAAVSPRRAHETSIDLAATLELVDFLGERGCSAIALLGSTGEFIHFAADDRRHMVRFAAKRSRVPLIVNVSHSTLDGAVDLARDASEDGVAGVMIMPPYYFRYEQPEILAFMLMFAKEMNGAVPIYLYNIPLFTNPLALETATELLQTGLYAGIKDSSGDPAYLAALPSTVGDLEIRRFVGSEAVYTEARIGGVSGAISGIASAFPELLASIDRAICGGDFEKARSLDRYLQELLIQMRAYPLPVAIVEALRVRKQKMGAFAIPMSEGATRRLAEFREWFSGWLPEVLKQCAG